MAFCLYSFITYRSCRHLDGKHTVFGKMVGGMDTLNEMEKVEVDNKDHPIEDIIIQKADIFVDPYQEADEQLEKERQEEKQKVQTSIQEQQKKAKQNLKPVRSGIGKYLTTDILPTTSTAVKRAAETEIPAKKKKVEGFGNFSSW